MLRWNAISERVVRVAPKAHLINIELGELDPPSAAEFTEVNRERILKTSAASVISVVRFAPRAHFSGIARQRTSPKKPRVAQS
jgi:hypothetical protein